MPWKKLSNMYIGPNGEGGFYVRLDSNTIFIPCVEIFFQAAKATNKEDKMKILNSENGFEAKKLGRKVTLRSDWNEVKISLMKWALIQKFQHPEMRALLESTDNSILVEKAPWDSFWGDGKDGSGKNWMGRLLMEIRAELRRR
jgi:ribA/ribD-fused uncharacterized protein